MLLPILARAPFYHSIDVSCMLEIVFGIAAVTAGLTHGYVTGKINSVFRTAFFFLVLVVGSITAYLYEKNFFVIIVCFFMVSIGFNHFRADLRAHFAKKFDADIAGEIVAIANSWSLPIIIVYAACFYFISLYDTHSKITLMFPAGYMLSAGWFIYVLNSTYAQEKSDGI